MIDLSSVVFVVDDDGSIRAAVASLLGTVGRAAQRVAGAREFASHTRSESPACLVLDVRLPAGPGAEARDTLASGVRMPIVFITSHEDLALSVRAITPDGLEFESRPFGDRALLEEIQSVVARAENARREHTQTSQLRMRFDELTPRERQVFRLVVEGRLNKQVAVELGISQVTVKIHRARVMQKMRAESLADLVRMAARLGLSSQGK